MQDWQDYKYTLAVTYSDGISNEIHSDNMLFLVLMGEDGLSSGLYVSATIHSNEGVIIYAS